MIPHRLVTGGSELFDPLNGASSAELAGLWSVV